MTELGHHWDVTLRTEFVERDSQDKIVTRHEAAISLWRIPSVGERIPHPHDPRDWIIRRLSPLRWNQEGFKGAHRDIFAALATPATQEEEADDE